MIKNAWKTMLADNIKSYLLYKMYFIYTLQKVQECCVNVPGTHLFYVIGICDLSLISPW